MAGGTAGARLGKEKVKRRRKTVGDGNRKTTDAGRRRLMAKGDGQRTKGVKTLRETGAKRTEAERGSESGTTCAVPNLVQRVDSRTLLNADVLM